MQVKAIAEMLADAREMGASDLHIVPGAPPTVRIAGQLISVDSQTPLGPDDTASLVGELLSSSGFEKAWEDFLDGRKELDCGFFIPGAGRIRCNVFFDRGAVAAALRLIPLEIPELHELGLPPVVGSRILNRVADQPKGLVLITGPTGSGKTTTMASMVRMIAAKFRRRIITIEDPIEYELSHGLSLVSQKEVGRDTLSFADGLRSALREDPDIILVGEMRDLETISIALTAAETGHLVISTLHTNDAPGAVDRIIDVFPPFQQSQIRTQLSEVLFGVLAQMLLPRRTPARGRPELNRRVLACEVLLGPMADVHAVRAAIREGKTASLYSIMETGLEKGMQTMEKSLADLVRQGLITKEVALASATRQEQLRALLGT